MCKCKFCMGSCTFSCPLNKYADALVTKAAKKRCAAAGGACARAVRFSDFTLTLHA